MTYEQAREEARQRMPEYLRSIGLSDYKPFRCLNPEHTDKSPSMSLDKKNNKVHCFACGATYDIFDLVGLEYNITDTSEVFKKTYDLLNIQVDEYESNRSGASKSSSRREEQPKEEDQKENKIEYYKSCMARLNKTDYLTKRGIPEETALKYMVGYDPNFSQGTGGKKWEALIIPTGRNEFVARNTDTEADNKSRYRNVGSNLIFNALALEKSKRPIFVTEGEIDALSIISLGFEAIGLGSTSNVKKLLEILKEKKPEQPLILALDNDESGKKAEEELKEGLEALKVLYHRPFNNLYAKYKDANERLLNDKEAFKNILEVSENIALENAEENLKEAGRRKEAEEQKKKAEKLEEYKKANSASYAVQGFVNGIAESVNTEPIRTGFNSLDSALDGGLYEGLHIVGAISSLGKTTLIMQIADQIAEQGQDVLIISLEMSKFELMAKSISRLTFIDCLTSGADTKNAKTNRGITTGSRYKKYSKEENDIIKRAITDYSSYAEHLFIYEGVGDIDVMRIREIVNTHKELTGKAPVIMVDYLQIISPISERATDKQNTDKAVLELRRIARDYKIPVIAISSLNRNSYREKISMESFKESGAIEYSSDVLIGLQLQGIGTQNFDLKEAKQKNPREVELIIIKQRSGPVEKPIKLNYYAMFNYFQEVEEKKEALKGSGKKRG